MIVTISGNNFEIDDEVLSKAIEEKTGITIESDLVIKTKEQDERSRSNAVTTSLEMQIKKIRDEKGLEGKPKTINDLISIIENKKVEDPEIKKQIEHFKKMYEDQEQKTIEVTNKFNSYRTESTINEQITKSYNDKSILSKDDYVSLFKLKYNPQIDENNNVFCAVGSEKLTNVKTLDPLSINEVSQKFFDENKHYLKQIEGGRNEKDEKQSTSKQNLDSFNKAYELKGNIGDANYNIELNKAIITGDVTV